MQIVLRPTHTTIIDVLVLAVDDLDVDHVVLDGRGNLAPSNSPMSSHNLADSSAVGGGGLSSACSYVKSQSLSRLLPHVLTFTPDPVVEPDGGVGTVTTANTTRLSP